MTQKEIGEAFMAVGALDDLSECIECKGVVDLNAVPDNIRICTDRIAKGFNDYLNFLIR